MKIFICKNTRNKLKSKCQVFYIKGQNLFVRVVWEAAKNLKISFTFVNSEKMWISGNHTTATIVN